MTKKDYDLIAKQIRMVKEGSVDPYRLAGVESVAIALARSFEAVNARFNTERFMKACGF